MEVPFFSTVKAQFFLSYEGERAPNTLVLTPSALPGEQFQIHSGGEHEAGLTAAFGAEQQGTPARNPNEPFRQTNPNQGKKDEI